MKERVAMIFNTFQTVEPHYDPLLKNYWKPCPFQHKLNWGNVEKFTTYYYYYFML